MTWHELMTWHEVRDADLKDCLEIEPSNLGDGIIGRECALTIWKQLVHSRCFNSAVVTAPPSISPVPIVAFGCSTFVTADFVNAELHNLKPGLNDRIIASIASGNSVLPDEANICDPNASPLDLVILMGTCRDGCMTPEHSMQAQASLPFAFFEALVGYRLNRVILETSSEFQHAFNMSSGVWRTIAVYPGGKRNLMLMTRESVASVSGSVAAELYQYQPPVLKLRDNDKELLSHAIHGETDAQLASRMNLSPASIKKRWSTLFDRVADVRPDLLPEVDVVDVDVRGPQKRHRILSYVRSHPQELRPFRWRSFRHA